VHFNSQQLQPRRKVELERWTAYPGLILHDLRRCGARGLPRAGVAQKTVTTITGHKRVAVFHRYHIVAPSDLDDATRKLEVNQQMEREIHNAQSDDFGRTSGIVAPKLGQTCDSVEIEAGPGQPPQLIVREWVMRNPCCFAGA
jgi:hypothetical protein